MQNSRGYKGQDQSRKSSSKHGPMTRLLGDNGTVDPISLWLSIPNSADERIGAAKDALFKKVGL